MPGLLSSSSQFFPVWSVITDTGRWSGLFNLLLLQNTMLRVVTTSPSTIHTDGYIYPATRPMDQEKVFISAELHLITYVRRAGRGGENCLIKPFQIRLEIIKSYPTRDLVSTRGLMADGLDSGFIKNDSVTIQRSFYCQGWLDCFPELSASVVL